MSSVKIQTAPALPGVLLRKYTSIAVLVDENTRQHCYPLIQKRLPAHSIIEAPSGEEHKNLATCQFIWQRMTELGLDRHSCLIVLGGGVLGDMGGFCAATFKRGVDFLLMPTTLLAQVDASIGGKTGIDFTSLKNHIGLFQTPVATLIATDFLKTLPIDQLRSGFAEVIKHCLISDSKTWEKIRKKDLAGQDWGRLVKQSIAFKSAVVKKDPREKGLRKILNFGHSIGHAIEGFFLGQGTGLTHGEAVAAGMVIEARIAAGKKMLTEKEGEAIRDYIIRIFGKTDVPETGRLLQFLLQDKKNKGNKILMALPDHIGKARWDLPVSEHEIARAIEYYQSSQT